MVCTLLHPMSYVPIFGRIKGLIDIHTRGKFHKYSICGCQVIYLQRYSEQQKVGFLAAFGWFFKDYSPKWGWICTKLSPVMQCKVTHHLYYGFSQNVKNSENLAQNLNFWLIFGSFSVTPSYTLSGRSQF